MGSLLSPGGWFNAFHRAVLYCPLYPTAFPPSSSFKTFLGYKHPLPTTSLLRYTFHRLLCLHVLIPGVLQLSFVCCYQSISILISNLITPYSAIYTLHKVLLEAASVSQFRSILYVLSFFSLSDASRKLISHNVVILLKLCCSRHL